MIFIIGFLFFVGGLNHMHQHGTGEIERHNPADYEGTGLVLLGAIVMAGWALWHVGLELLGYLS